MLKSWLKKIGIILIELAVIAGLLLYVYQKKGLESPSQIIPALQELVSETKTQLETEKKTNPFPELQNPVSREFNWEYKGVKYKLTETLYQSVYEYYKTAPKMFSYTGELKQNWQEEYYGMFLTRDENDKSIASLATKLQDLGLKHKLSDDQIVDLTLAFVQAIVYDDAKAKNILAQTNSETILYPYETLFQQSGVCSDKSLLAVALLREMGYGVAIFAYEQDNHMAIGIACPKNLSTYDSGYCYAETTSVGNKIGIIPSFDSVSNKAVGADELTALDSTQAQQAVLQQLTQVTIYQQTLGRQYLGIIETKKIIAEIDSLKKSITIMLPELQAQKKTIAKQEKKLEDMRNELEKLQNDQNVEKYNELVGEYNNYLENYKKTVKKYNEKVALYNKATARYNILIKQ
ncbi:MAG: hypothetical protein PHP62_03990 [Candidatus Moranbacteria bacterium]|nr:hypothetical protein [Candidatus Moranbacteria bacterium]